MFSFRNIYKAYKECRKNKSNTLNLLHFEADLLQNICHLEESLKSRTYCIGKSICFLTHSPKMREVFAAQFKDRVVHHILVKEIEPFYEKKFIYDIYNNRKDKGIHSAAKRAKKFMRQNIHGYYLQLDIKGFFYNLDKNILFKQLFKDIDSSNLQNKNDILWLANKIIYHNPTRNYHFKGDIKSLQNLPAHKTLFKLPPNKGLPIGNLTSQFFANVYMNRFDHFIKRELKAKRYIRYVDDFVLFSDRKEKLWQWYEKIKVYLKTNLSLELRGDMRLRKNGEGLDFLGYIIRPHYMLVRKRVVDNYKYKKALYLTKYEKQKGDMSFEEIKDFLSLQSSFVAHAKHANSYRIIKKTGEIDEKKYIKLITTSWSGKW